MHRMRTSMLGESRLGLVALLTTVLLVPLGNASAKERKAIVANGRAKPDTSARKCLIGT
jgi:hypothetical protein